jgi:taurine dioxygenase
MTGSLAWRKLEPFGVEIERDLSQPLSGADAEQLRALFNQHGLLLARGQALSMERQRELCGLLGPILLREGENGYMVNDPGPASSGLNWHSDAAYTDDPFDALSLHALEVVDEASSTLFASAEIALPEHLRVRLDGREQEMIAHHYTAALEAVTCDLRDPPFQKRGVKPAFYVNPHNGKTCVWVSSMQTTRVLDMDWEESRCLLHEVYDELYAPANVFEHRWRNGDLIIWDNIALQHMRGNIESVGKRLLQRVIVGKAGVAPHIGN